MRVGCSIAGAVYSAIQPGMEPKVQVAHTQTVQREAAAAGTLAVERENHRRMGSDVWSRRPSHVEVSYCGVQEFDSVYYVREVKNQDGDCRSFEPKSHDHGLHTCGTCVHNLTPSNRVRIELQKHLEFAFSEGSRPVIKADINAAIDARAGYEYETAIQGSGFVDFPTAFLPRCAERSTEQRTVVGPVVNAGGNCDKWVQGTARSDVDSRLDELLVTIQRAEQVKNSNPDLLSLRPPDIDAIIWMEYLALPLRRAKMDLVAYCLSALGLPPDQVESLRVSLTADEFPNKSDADVERRARDACRYSIKHLGYVHAALPRELLTDVGTQPAPTFADQPAGADQAQTAWQDPAAVATGAATAAHQGVAHQGIPIQQTKRKGWLRSLIDSRDDTSSQRPPTPFLMMANKEYKHPKRRGVTVRIEVTHTQSRVLVQSDGQTCQFDLWAFPREMWTPLQSPAGQLPIALFSRLPDAVYGSWL